MQQRNPYHPPPPEQGPSAIAVPGAFTVLDWIGVVVTVLAVLATCLCSINASVFESMYLDLGAGSLPPLTRLAVRPWFGLLLATPAAVMVAVALGNHRRFSLGCRRALVVVAFGLALAAGALILIGLYQPIFSLAGQVRSS